MHAYLPYLDPLISQEKEMLYLLKTWSQINSWSENSEGLIKMTEALTTSFTSLNGVIEYIPLPNRQKIDSQGHLTEVPSSSALSVKKERNVPTKVFLAGHMDTVYPPTSSFQQTDQLDSNILRGPGVADMKGGLVILLKALELFERSPFAEKLSWEVLINPDEEIGSPSSAHLFTEKARQFTCGLIFEPSFPDGSLVNERKGSINYIIISRGKAAHAGRDFYSGRNAITALARLVQSIESLNDRQKGITVNVGSFEGGGAANIVPDLAICKINIRLQNPRDLDHLTKRIEDLVKKETTDGITLEFHEQSLRPPKPFNKSNRELFEALETCAKGLGIEMKWQPSGGVCDGNTLSAAGLPTIDTLGAIGGHIHTHDEYILISSLMERTKLTACFLMQLAENAFFLENPYV